MKRNVAEDNDYFSSDATIVSEEVSEVAQIVSEEHDESPNQDQPLPTPAQNFNFSSDITVVNDAINKVAEAIQNNGSSVESNNDVALAVDYTDVDDENIATDVTVVNGSVSDFLQQNAKDSTPSYFESDVTIVNQDMSQVVNEVESGQSSVEESIATDMTVVEGNVSDFVSKEPQSAPPSLF